MGVTHRHTTVIGLSSTVLLLQGVEEAKVEGIGKNKA